MKEIPILFSTPMVRAILEGRKSQTRRIVKPQAMVDANGFLDWDKAPDSKTRSVIKYLPETVGLKDYCPYGKPGDIIWVRETWRKYCYVDEYGYTHYDKETIEYAADNPPMINEVDGDGCKMFNKDGTEKFIRWRPSIFMPKEAARIWLKVESIRVERLQDIPCPDIEKEGISLDQIKGCDPCLPASVHLHHEFKKLWDQINGADSWQANPWVWVISFSVLSTTGKPSPLTSKVNA